MCACVCVCCMRVRVSGYLVGGIYALISTGTNVAGKPAVFRRYWVIKGNPGYAYFVCTKGFVSGTVCMRGGNE